MRMYDIIKKKRDNEELTKEEINFFVTGFTNGSIPYLEASLVATVRLTSTLDEETETKPPMLDFEG